MVKQKIMSLLLCTGVWRIILSQLCYEVAENGIFKPGFHVLFSVFSISRLNLTLIFFHLHVLSRDYSN